MAAHLTSGQQAKPNIDFTLVDNVGWGDIGCHSIPVPGQGEYGLAPWEHTIGELCCQVFPHRARSEIRGVHIEPYHRLETSIKPSFD